MAQEATSQERASQERANQRAPEIADASRTGRLQVIPAVDVLGEEAVRLRQGDFAQVAVREPSALELVERFATEGAALVHLVDLSAARSGRIRPELVRRAVEAAGASRIQAAGGIRSIADAERLLHAGAERVVVGTAAFAEPDAAARYAAALGDRLVVAIDVRDGRVAVNGWERTTALTTEEAVDVCVGAGVSRLLCTAIERDGMLDGVDADLLALVCQRSRLPVLAAGGVSSASDLEAVRAAGCEGAIVGRALLEGGLSVSAFAAQA